MSRKERLFSAILQTICDDYESFAYVVVCAYQEFQKTNEDVSVREIVEALEYLTARHFALAYTLSSVAPHAVEVRMQVEQIAELCFLATQAGRDFQMSL